MLKRTIAATVLLSATVPLTGCPVVAGTALEMHRRDHEPQASCHCPEVDCNATFEQEPGTLTPVHPKNNYWKNGTCYGTGKPCQ